MLKEINEFADIAHNMGATIMDLIGSIKYIESRFGGRKHSQSKGKSAQKNIRSDAMGEKNAQSNTYHSSAEYDARLGRKVNVTA